MSIRCSGLARRSFIIGSRLCPPAMIRASEPRRWSASIAPSTVVARWYSNEAGVCTSALLSLRGGAVFGVGRVGVDLARRGGGVLQVWLRSLRELRPPVGGRVGIVAGARVDAA